MQSTIWSSEWKIQNAPRQIQNMEANKYRDRDEDKRDDDNECRPNDVTSDVSGFALDADGTCSFSIGTCQIGTRRFSKTTHGGKLDGKCEWIIYTEQLTSHCHPNSGYNTSQVCD